MSSQASVGPTITNASRPSTVTAAPLAQTPNRQPTTTSLSRPSASASPFVAAVTGAAPRASPANLLAPAPPAVNAGYGARAAGGYDPGAGDAGTSSDSSDGEEVVEEGGRVAF